MNELSLLLLKQGGGTFWVVQCLEYDIAAQGKTIQDALSAFDESLMAEIIFSAHHKEQPLGSVAPAPKYYWRMYDKVGMPLEVPRRTPYTSILGGDRPVTLMPAYKELRVA